MRYLTIPVPPAEPRAGRPWRLAFDDSARILSRADCEALFHRIVGFGTGDADTTVTLRSTWSANFRWGRSRPTSSGDTTERVATIVRSRGNTGIIAEVAKLDDASLKQTVQALDQRLASVPAQPSNGSPLGLLTQQQYLEPTIWSDATYEMQVEDLSEAVRRTVDPVADAKLVAAGYAEAGATTWAIFNTRGLAAYAAATGALYTETVRNLEGTASGWAGKSHMAWAKLDPVALSGTALKKCVDSANPVAIEPGRYTTILEPDVVSRMFSFAVHAMDRDDAETGQTVYTLTPPQGNQRGTTKLGTLVFDHRLTITSDPTDSDCGYMPFDPDGNPYTKVTWVEQGILKALSYDRAYAHQYLGTDVALPNPEAFRVSGGDTSIAEMIATTERGILVTNTSGLAVDDPQRLGLTCVTRNGLWLIEHGKISHPIKNLWVNESPMDAFNKVLQIGPTVRTYGADRRGWGGILRDLPARALNDGRTPIVAPAMKVQDFNFTRLTDAI